MKQTPTRTQISTYNYIVYNSLQVCQNLRYNLEEKKSNYLTFTSAEKPVCEIQIIVTLVWFAAVFSEIPCNHINVYNMLMLH